MDESDGTSDSILKHKPIWATYSQSRKKEKKRTIEKKKQGDLHRTYGTRVIPVWAQQLLTSCFVDCSELALLMPLSISLSLMFNIAFWYWINTLEISLYKSIVLISSFLSLLSDQLLVLLKDLSLIFWSLCILLAEPFYLWHSMVRYAHQMLLH